MSDIPAIVLGHGNPMNAIARNSISAHWFLPTTKVSSSAAPRTIHDFCGFPLELYQVDYPVLGDPGLARRVQRLLSPLRVDADDSWGLDHGTWSVLRHVYPNADVPVVQLSIQATQPAEFHFGLGRRLAPLRTEGVPIAGSGNLVHNLRAYAWGHRMIDPYDWAVRFENIVKHRILAGDLESLVDYETLGTDAALPIPAPDHDLRLLYVLGAGRPAGRDDRISGRGHRGWIDLDAGRSNRT